MKIARFCDRGDSSQERWGSVNTEASTVQIIGGPFEEWAAAIAAGELSAVGLTGDPLPLESVRLLAPISPRSEIVGTGINYPNWVLPWPGIDTPFYYKPRQSIIGTEQEIKWARLEAAQPQTQLCYELELVVVLGAPVDDRANPMPAVLGYAVGNDTCIRGMRPSFLGMDLPGSKSAFHATGIGPWITTKDEVGGNGQPDLEMVMRVNGTVTQHDRTSAMSWKVERVLREADLRCRLAPGDAVFTGTCGFVGVPDGFYQPGDLIEAEIEGLGVLRNRVQTVNPYAAVHPVP
ncbi:2-keto-4-pentenoate hydratase/2-oxohepta-3-ene-1,7-dioic acid hydratase in catechol pathway [Streptomyces sp. LBL]|uniref:fumarylacetoacetate hydrolase family protein n=1 Tax=Streptomyces sp. LBL TaxID=2940562 RepID=UPI0024763AE3|nr:fumarylacetoacetate hydrolase family protein [Streptomyces sp. LBL]MDH6629841.1 2-keto-4-pentenoate hydratase/2-oxohepta-3-ene-1,7-dioic acid hydratase in catechol pathway [Streptomyces sp. LBL]